ncbi:hypothetical protein ACF0H5_005064 [Mactra antiquata]
MKFTVYVTLQTVTGYLLSNNNEYQVYLTTGDQSKKLSREAALTPTNQESGYNLWVDRRKRRQTIEGFGGALTNSAAYAIYNSPVRSQVIRDLFGQGENELGITYLRIVMGGSDFNAVPTYTYDDMGPGQTDFDMNHFSIQADKAFFIPVIKEALSVYPNLKILATPWSAPGWMKTSHGLNGGEFINDGRYMQAYALYFAKFIEAYRSEGIQIESVSCQNEPLLSRDDYPTMKMSADVQKAFIRDHLGPLFRQRNINTKILVFDHNWSDPWYPESVVNDDNVKQYISGVAWHGYGGRHDEPGTFHNSHPDVGNYFTEITGGDWDTNFASGLTWDNRIITIGQTKNWAKAVFFFNIALDQNHGPRVSGLGGCGDCRGIVTVPSGSHSFTKNVEYYALGHLSKFVKPGAVRLETNNFGWDDLHAVAFSNTDGTTVVVAANPNGSKQATFSINIDAQHYVYYNLPPNSVATFIK